VPLSAPAMMLLASIKKDADTECPFVFPGPDGKSPLTDIKRSWLSICRAAGLAVEAPALNAKGKPVKDTAGKPVLAWQSTVRIHDLRHSYASILVSGGASLPLIGALLGHTQPATTHRYAHLLDDPLRAATERVGAVVSGGKGADVVPFDKVRA
jgi:integrase